MCRNPQRITLLTECTWLPRSSPDPSTAQIRGSGQQGRGRVLLSLSYLLYTSNLNSQKLNRHKYHACLSEDTLLWHKTNLKVMKLQGWFPGQGKELGTLRFMPWGSTVSVEAPERNCMLYTFRRLSRATSSSLSLLWHVWGLLQLLGKLLVLLKSFHPHPQSRAGTLCPASSLSPAWTYSWDYSRVVQIRPSLKFITHILKGHKRQSYTSGFFFPAWIL